MEQDAFLTLCRLARLELDLQERLDFGAKFESLLGFVEKVRTWESAGPAHDEQPGSKLVLRRDTVEEYEWPEGGQHVYSAPRTIDFEDQ
jgi:Asp-tRNA(Asn)/Glu-tRNA(Gln) amidotransferase C subunit